MRPSLALALALVLAPLAAAIAGASSTCDPSGTACATDSTSGDGTCDQGGYEYRDTSVTVAFNTLVRGYSLCSGSYETDEFSVANGLVVWGHLTYDDPDTGQFDGCYLLVAGQFVPCPAGPPNPGWGHVLP